MLSLIEQLIQRNLAEGSDIAVSAGVSQDMIQQAESMLGVRFPVSYRAFLATYGAIEIDCQSFAGLTTEGKVGDDGDVVSFTRYAREDYRLPDPYVALDFQDGDFWLCLDTSQVDQQGESPVVLVSPVDGKRSGPAVAESWASFLASYLAA
ncbi:SMI1 / KNR4 family [Bordetella ansorpii]|uniref:SMI1 / KNR4 family n=1 Tax=Bordetella ansorpii TaxID=288768 RepID=A0A157NX82_9BORD|nr:SMI1/KNR4 family protein [Bordetella ansorpii]SAI25821.1 SMI1 / KNR4 family [Bordetella ansorpii]